MREITYPRLHTAHGRQLGPYQLLLQIARGGMADVFLALAPAERPGGPRRQVVLKLLRSEVVDDDEFRTMFVDEGRLATRLAHPNVVSTFGVGHAGDERFLVMEFLDGQPLSRIRRRGEREGGVPTSVQLRALTDVLAGIHYLHELRDDVGRSLGVVHRDVTPQNVFVTYEGHVKVLDFGIAKAASRLAETRVGVVKGKLPYMSPESVRGEHVDRRSDVFSVGIMVWEAATGARFWQDHDELTVYRRLVSGDVPLRALDQRMPAPLREVITRAIAARPEDRFPTAAAMQSELERALRPFGKWASRAFLREHVATTFGEEREAFHEQVHAELVRLDAGRASAPPALSGARELSRSVIAPLAQSSPGTLRTDMNAGYDADDRTPPSHLRTAWPVALAVGSLVLSSTLFTYALHRHRHRPGATPDAAVALTLTGPERAVSALEVSALTLTPPPDAPVVPTPSAPAEPAPVEVVVDTAPPAPRADAPAPALLARTYAAPAKRPVVTKPVEHALPPGESLPRPMHAARTLDARDPWTE